MSAKIERGKPLFVLFCNGMSVSDAHGKPRIYKTRRGFETRCPVDDRCAPGAELVEYREVRHGQNVTPTHFSDRFVCSECGFCCEITELRYGDDGMGEPEAYEYECKLCPDCGAKMDAEET